MVVTPELMYSAWRPGARSPALIMSLLTPTLSSIGWRRGGFGVVLFTQGGTAPQEPARSDPGLDCGTPLGFGKGLFVSGLVDEWTNGGHPHPCPSPIGWERGTQRGGGLPVAVSPKARNDHRLPYAIPPGLGAPEFVIPRAVERMRRSGPPRCPQIAQSQWPNTEKGHKGHKGRKRPAYGGMASGQSSDWAF
jgi:hypothetical protein